MSALPEDKKAALTKALGELSELHGSLLILYYLQGRPLEHVAMVLGLSPEEMLIEHHSALLALRAQMPEFDGI